MGLDKALKIFNFKIRNLLLSKHSASSIITLCICFFIIHSTFPSENFMN